MLRGVPQSAFTSKTTGTRQRVLGGKRSILFSGFTPAPKGLYVSQRNNLGDNLSMNSTLTKKRLMAIASSVGFTIFLALSPVLFFQFSEWLSYKKSADLIQAAHQEKLIPAVTWVRSFVREHNRLPTKAEINYIRPDLFVQHNVAIYRRGELELPFWGPSDRDFVIATCVQEWNLFYCSWDDQILEYWNE